MTRSSELDTGSTLTWEGGPLGASSEVITVTALVGEPRPTLLLLNTWTKRINKLLHKEWTTDLDLILRGWAQAGQRDGGGAAGHRDIPDPGHAPPRHAVSTGLPELDQVSQDGRVTWGYRENENNRINLSVVIPS